MRRFLPSLVPMTLALGLACRVPPRATGDEAPVPALDAAAIDRSVSPCEDFYAFACGGWIASTPVPPDRLSLERGAGALEERNARDLRRILEDARGGKADARADAREKLARKAGEFYGVCMDEAAVDARGLADLLAEWAAIDAVQDRGGLVEGLGHLETMGLSVPFAVGVTSPAGPGARAELSLGVDGLGLPDRALYLDPAAEPVRTLYAAHVQAMLQLAGVAASQAQAEAAAVLGLERGLAEPSGSLDAGDPATAAVHLDAAGLQRLAPGFPWTLFFGALGIARPAVLTVTAPALVSRAGDLFEQAPLETWKAYLRWRVTDAMAAARALPARMVEERFRFRGAAFGGPPAQRPRWKDCVAATERALGPALGELYVRRVVRAERRERAAHLAIELQRALDAELRRLPWMDDATRGRARERLSHLTIRTGGPEPGREEGALRVGRDSYFRNVLSAGRLEVRRRLEEVGRTPAEREWPTSAASVRVVYDPAQNALFLPGGVLQPPFFEDGSEELRHGAGGTLLGGALVAALEAGAGQGGAPGWWTGPTAAQFQGVTACLARESGAVAPGAEASAAALEELADLGGVHLAWSALQYARAGTPAARKLHGLTPDQQFFVAFAQVRCTARREDDRTEGRPMRARVNGALSSAEEFAAAFGCKEGSAMVRPAGARCGAW